MNQNTYHQKYMSNAYYRFEKSAYPDLYYSHLMITCQNDNRNIKNEIWTKSLEECIADGLITGVDEWERIQAILTVEAPPWVPGQREFVVALMGVQDKVSNLDQAKTELVRAVNQMGIDFAPPAQFLP